MHDSNSKITASIELCLVLESRLVKLSKTVQEATHLSLLMRKIIKTGRAIQLLHLNGYNEDASILTRSVFELVVLFLWIIKKDTLNRIERHNDYVYFNYHLEIQKYLSYLDTRKTPNNMESEEQRRINNTIKVDLLKTKDDKKIKELCDKYDEENINESNYMYKLIPRIKDMATKVGMKQQFMTVYWIDSSFVHSRADSLQGYEDNAPSNNGFQKFRIVNDFLYFIWYLSFYANKKFHFGLEYSISLVENLALKSLKDTYKSAL